MYISGKTSQSYQHSHVSDSGEWLCPDCALLGVEDGGWSLAFSAGLCRCDILGGDRPGAFPNGPWGPQ